MTKNEMMGLAAEAGLWVTSVERLKAVEKFAELVEAAEREAIAKIADGWPDYNVQGLAEAIRARGLQDMNKRAISEITMEELK